MIRLEGNLCPGGSNNSFVQTNRQHGLMAELYQQVERIMFGVFRNVNIRAAWGGLWLKLPQSRSEASSSSAVPWSLPWRPNTAASNSRMLRTSTERPTANRNLAAKLGASRATQAEGLSFMAVGLLGLAVSLLGLLCLAAGLVWSLTSVVGLAGTTWRNCTATQIYSLCIRSCKLW